MKRSTLCVLFIAVAVPLPACARLTAETHIFNASGECGVSTEQVARVLATVAAQRPMLEAQQKGQARGNAEVAAKLKSVQELRTKAEDAAKDNQTDAVMLVLQSDAVLEEAARGVANPIDAKNIRELNASRLSGDSRAPAVVQSEEKCWRPSRPYERARAGAGPGNADIAIKMEADGAFAVKGVRVDATKVTEAIFKSAGKAIRLAAGMAGVGGFAGGSSAGGGDDENVHERLSAAQAEVGANRGAAVLILDQIVAADGKLADKDDRSKALEAVKRAIEAHAAELVSSPTE